jgi:hypothetical protein
MQMVRTPLAIMNCPSRRRAVVYPDAGWLWAYNMDNPGNAGRSDYSANAGDRVACAGTPRAPGSLAEADSFTGWMHLSGWQHNGICYQLSEVTMGDVKDGASNTYAVGEKYINPDHYLDGKDSSDNESMYVGDDRDVLSNTRYDASNVQASDIPRRDRPGLNPGIVFGSPHAGGWNVAFCDASVQTMSYSIDPLVHSYLGNRRDQKPIDASEL